MSKCGFERKEGHAHTDNEDVQTHKQEIRSAPSSCTCKAAQANQSQQIAPPRPMIRVNPDEFAAKYQGKREVWRFLSTDCKAYLSSYDTMNVFHLRDLASNKRRRIHCDDVKYINVPHFEGLSVKEMLEFAS